LRSNSTLYETVRSRNISFNYFDLAGNLQAQFSELNVLQPDVIVAPKTVLLAMADSMSSGTIRVKPRQVISGAEPLDDVDRKKLSDIFAQPVQEIYQCTEGFLGFTCTHAGMHLCEDLVVVEREPIAGHPNKFLPIITDIVKTTQPLIRYRMTDIVTDSNVECPCGSAMSTISKIEGRLEDSISVIKRSSGQRSLLLPSEIEAIILPLTTEGDFQFIQVSLDEVKILLKTTDLQEESKSQQICKRIQQLFQQRDLINPRIQLDSLIPHSTFDSKIPKVTSLVSRNL